MPEYEARIYYSTYVPVVVEAGSEEEAIEKAREVAFWVTMPYDSSDIKKLLQNLEPWEECDEAEEI